MVSGAQKPGGLGLSHIHCCDLGQVVNVPGPLICPRGILPWELSGWKRPQIKGSVPPKTRARSMSAGGVLATATCEGAEAHMRPSR